MYSYFYEYYPTQTEQFVESFYKNINILSPNQLDIINIASKLNIWIYFKNMNSQSIDYKGLYSIIIDRRISPAEQWEEFGHEIAHILRHAGNQLLMTEDYLRYQEIKADNFALEFCVPTFMLLNMKLPQTIKEASEVISETFNVTLPFAYKRLERFRERLIIAAEYKAAYMY